MLKCVDYKYKLCIERLTTLDSKHKNYKTLLKQLSKKKLLLIPEEERTF